MRATASAAVCLHISEGLNVLALARYYTADSDESSALSDDVDIEGAALFAGVGFRF